MTGRGQGRKARSRMADKKLQIKNDEGQLPDGGCPSFILKSFIIYIYLKFLLYSARNENQMFKIYVILSGFQHFQRRAARQTCLFFQLKGCNVFHVNIYAGIPGYPQEKRKISASCFTGYLVGEVMRYEEICEFHNKRKEYIIYFRLRTKSLKEIL